MFSLARRRREAQRQKNLEEQFSKKDENGNGRVLPEQMIKIFEDNEVEGTKSRIFRKQGTPRPVPHAFLIYFMHGSEALFPKQSSSTQK